MKFKLIAFLLFLICLSCNLNEVSSSKNGATNHPNNINWRINSINKWAANAGLINVESIIYDETNDVFYATNGLDYKEGTDGFISKISASGQMEELKWVAGLNRPTGMAILDSLLYVADVNRLLSINTRNGNINDRFIQPMENSGLNDVAISPEGKVFVTASFVHSVFSLEGSELLLWTQDEEKLKWANGIVSTTGGLIVGGTNLSNIDAKSKEITHLTLDPRIVDFDGLAADGMGGYFVTTVENSGLFHIDKRSNVTKLISEEIYFADLVFDQENKRLFIPRGDKTAREYFISVVQCEL